MKMITKQRKQELMDCVNSFGTAIGALQEQRARIDDELEITVDKAKQWNEAISIEEFDYVFGECQRASRVYHMIKEGLGDRNE
jgi:hypothetical protein